MGSLLAVLLVLSPSICRDYGVYVLDVDVPTGTVVEEHQVGWAKLSKECTAPASFIVLGCTQAAKGKAQFPAQNNEYVLWYADSCTMTHERCHAVYEEAVHTDGYLQKSNSGDIYAACPSP